MNHYGKTITKEFGGRAGDSRDGHRPRIGTEFNLNFYVDGSATTESIKS